MLKQTFRFVQKLDNTGYRLLLRKPRKRTHWGFYVSAPSNYEYSRLGIMMKKKDIRLSSTRNRYKRCLREWFRKQQFQTPQDILIMLNPKQCLTKQELWQCLNKIPHPQNTN